MIGVGYVECPAFEGGLYAVILGWMFLLNMIVIRSCLRVRADRYKNPKSVKNKSVEVRPAKRSNMRKVNDFEDD